MTEVITENKQVTVVKSGNEMAAVAAKQINYHVMGFYPITPSTQIAETVDEMKANGEHDIKMIPGDGEHGAAGICYGAATGGGRVFNATSANGLLYSLEQLPVQSGTRFPMVLNVVTRSFSGPLDIKGDHSDLMTTLNMGWIILLAKDPQRGYDMNIIAVKIGEQEKVRLPVIVSSDGFFTSHQKRRVQYFENKETVQGFIGPFKAGNHALDAAHPVTIGPYMNEPDLINNKKQLSLAMAAAYEALPGIFEEYGKLSGRKYSMVETFELEDAEAALFILNSSFDTAKEAVIRLRKEGKKVGLLAANVLRPWPYHELISACKNLRALCVADRQDSFSGQGGNMTLELKATLQDDPQNRTRVFSRIYGLGGKDFYVGDAVALLNEALEVAVSGRVKNRYDYLGASSGDLNYQAESMLEPIPQAKSGLPENFNLVKDETTGITKVKGVNLRELTGMPKRVVSGHRACPGCGIFPNLNLFLKGISGNVVVLFQTGCAMVVTTGFPLTSFRVTYIHNLFQNGAATLSGLVEMFQEKKRRGEIPVDDDFTFIMVTGDGGQDIGMGPTIGTALRNHKMIILEYDNGGYMNTGYQMSFTTPFAAKTTTSHIGPAQHGKNFFHKDTAQIIAATNIPYVCTVAECNPLDYVKKAAKAQKYSSERGLVYVKAISACPLNWGDNPRLERRVIQAGVDCCFFPLYEVEEGITNITYDPEKLKKKTPVGDWLKMMGRTRHLIEPEYAQELEMFQDEVDRRWERLKARHEHSLL